MNTAPFGFAIVDKGGRLWRAGRGVCLNPEPLKIDIKWLNSGDSPHTNGPYRMNSAAPIGVGWNDGLGNKR